MASDRKYVDGGATAVDGNYERTTSVAARAHRLLNMQRGKWAAARGRKTGSRLHTLQKDTEEERNKIPGMVEEAWEPLVDEGLITDIEVELYRPADRAVGYVASAFDKTTGSGFSLDVPVPWLE